MTIDGYVERLQQRIGHLMATDPQFAAAAPDDAIAEALEAPGLSLVDMFGIVMEGYADRPALGQRATNLRTDPVTGRTSLELLRQFDTITYRELSARLRHTAAGLADLGVRPGDRVACLGFTSTDYLVIDLAIHQLGAVAVPLPSGVPVSVMAPIVDEIKPRLLAASIGDLAEAVQLTASAPADFAALVVFDYRPEVDEQSEVFFAAQQRAEQSSQQIISLAAVERSGAELPLVSGPGDKDDDRTCLLIYTSGSTGTPKGAIYPERLLANWWRPRSFNPSREGRSVSLPSITLNFMPMSHGYGRATLYGALANGGTAYFVADSSLSTMLDDLALVRPTMLNFVPRIWDMLYAEFNAEVDRLLSSDVDRADVEAVVRKEQRDRLLGGRFYAALTGSAPTSSEMKAWAESYLDMPIVEGYGATEQGIVLADGHVRRPPVIEYKLVDVPELGYFSTDRPYPRGELLVKTEQLFGGYYNRPELTAEVFDADGFYRSGDIMAELGPDHLRYVDRRNNVLKLSQGEFVAIATVEACFASSPLIEQIYIYGNSARSFLLAVVVPTDDASGRYSADVLKAMIIESLHTVARSNELQPYEIPREVIVENVPFTAANGLLTGIGKLARPALREKYGDRLERLYSDLADRQVSELNRLKLSAADKPILETITHAATALVGAAGADVKADARFLDLGGDSLSAVAFSTFLSDAFQVDVPVSAIVSPANDLQALAEFIGRQQASASSDRVTFASIHGADCTEVHAGDLLLDRFVDTETLTKAHSLSQPVGEPTTVLLTGATGFLGRYLALYWLERLSASGGRLICLVRAKDDVSARARLDDVFDSGDTMLLERYRELAEGRLQVLASELSDMQLGLHADTWHRLAESVDLIVHPAAMVNHVLPYRELFAPNVVGTAELVRFALSSKLKRFAYVSTIGVGDGVVTESGLPSLTEDADIREVSATRKIADNYANGYSSSKWAGEVLLRNAFDTYGLPVTVFRCDMIMAEPRYTGQLNLPDMFTRMILSLVLTGLAPYSFYELGPDATRQRAHYDGLNVDFIAESIGYLSTSADGYRTYHVSNPHDDGIGLDQFVDWLDDAGYPITRIQDYDDWLLRFETALRALSEDQRQASLLPLLHGWRSPQPPSLAGVVAADRFEAAVREAGIGVNGDIPHLQSQTIVKYVNDLELLGLIPVSTESAFL